MISSRSTVCTGTVLVLVCQAERINNESKFLCIFIFQTSKSSTNQTKREKHKNLLSLARVAALILTSLVDRELLPVSVETFSEFVIKIFRQILTLKQNWSAEITGLYFYIIFI